MIWRDSIYYHNKDGGKDGCQCFAKYHPPHCQLDMYGFLCVLRIEKRSSIVSLLCIGKKPDYVVVYVFNGLELISHQVQSSLVDGVSHRH